MTDDQLRILTLNGPNITLTPATPAQIGRIRACWPLGVLDRSGGRSEYGLICRRDRREAMAVKFQQVDVPLRVTPLLRFQNRCLIALALRGYLARGHSGFIMPCAYARPKGRDRGETGIAYLVGPHPERRPVARDEPADVRWDGALGDGATAMVLDFAREVGRVIDKAPTGQALGGGPALGRPIFLTMELRPCSALGLLDSRIAVMGSDVFVTMAQPHRMVDSAWDFVAQAGFSSLTFTPLMPAEMRPDGSLSLIGAEPPKNEGHVVS